MHLMNKESIGHYNILLSVFSNGLSLQWLYFIATQDASNVVINLVLTNTVTYTVLTTVEGNVAVGENSATATAITWRAGCIYSFDNSTVTIRRVAKPYKIRLICIGF